MLATLGISQSRVPHDSVRRLHRATLSISEFCSGTVSSTYNNSSTNECCSDQSLLQGS